MLTFVRCCTATALLAVAARSTVAQVAEPLAATAAISESQRFARRLGAAFLGQIPIALGGALVGSAIADDLNVSCDCLVPGADEGALVGALIGASIFAALPDLASSCTGGQRWRRSLTGAAVAVAPAALFWAATGQRGFMAMTFVLAPLGAAGATHPC